MDDDRPVPAENVQATRRPMRADARRKRDAVLAAAVDAFVERGVNVALDEVARRAGVGIATLYRHFPTREALITGVYVREVDLLCDGVDALLAELPPDEALIAWMQRVIQYVADRPGMPVALKTIVMANDSDAAQNSHQRIYAALRQLMEAAMKDGIIRTDITVDDMAGALSGLSLISSQPGSQARSNRLVTVIVDGLRHQPPASPPGKLRSSQQP
ncbi:TetR/AcrR family transcriptional regulator [Streptomyces sp. SID1121]|uniref:TetR/AcrR family transcriptional regulator n=1 Tax=Streptomyces sp. SID1121 TaxID=3425888 RepID=UPI004056E935